MTIEIPLTKGYVAIVDDCDADLAELKWHFDEGYAVRTLAAKPYPTLIRMHRMVIERTLGRPLDKEERVDHINCDPLDNRRENLRLATHAQNGKNKKLFKNNTSGYKGVYQEKKTGKWCSKIMADGKLHHLGTFATKEEAYAVYCDAAQKLHGEYANTPNAQDVAGLNPKKMKRVLATIAAERNTTEADVIQQTYAQEGSIAATARKLGLSYQPAWRWVKKYVADS